MKLYKGEIALHCDDCLQDDAVVRTKGPHLGAYCKFCGKWLKWLSKAEKDLITVNNNNFRHTITDEPNIIHVSSIGENITDEEVPW
jgi:uncharacterized Zn finger protein